MSPLTIKLKRAYDAPSDDDGVRILVERLRPRVVSKSDAAIDCWMKDIAPTPALRTWFKHRPDRWEEFRARYEAELAENGTLVDELRSLCTGRRVTFVFAAKDLERNSARVLRDFLLSRPG